VIRTSLDGRSLLEEDSVFPPQWLLHSPGTGKSIGTQKTCPNQVHQHCHIQRGHKICSEYRLAYFGTCVHPSKYPPKKTCPNQVHQHCHIQRGHKICSEYRLAYFGTCVHPSKYHKKTCFVQRMIGNHSEHKENCRCELY